MKLRRLGSTALELSEIGFGAWAIGGADWKFGWGCQDDQESIEAIQGAIDLGINWIDTAPVYGLGHSEELVGRALQGRRSAMSVATKCSLVWDDQGNISSSLARESVRRECEASLRRLRTDRIDLYQIHWPNDEERLQEGWEEIGRLIQEGKVRYGGVSNFDIAQLERVERVRSVSSLQSRYSMIHREIEDGAIGYCSARGIGVLAYSPMASGLLSGQFDRSRLTAGDWRLSASEFQQPNLSTTLQLVDGLRGVADRLGKTVSQLAIAWVLRRPEVTSAIVGVRRLSQMQETARGAGWTIAPEIADEVERLLSIHRKMIPPEAARFR